MAKQVVRMLAAAFSLGVWCASGLAQQAEQSGEDLNRIIQRLEQQDRQAREDGFVLESFPVQQPEGDPRRKSMKLSVGEVGGNFGASPFDEPQRNYLLDPLTPIEAPPVGLNLKLQF